jgi:hypothetical protein
VDHLLELVQNSDLITLCDAGNTGVALVIDVMSISSSFPQVVGLTKNLHIKHFTFSQAG